MPHSVIFLPDLAPGLVTPGLADEAPGRVWHLPTNGAPTGREFVAVMSDALGKPLKVSGTPGWMLRLIGIFKPPVREIADIIYQWDVPFVSGDAAFQATFGPQQPNPLREAVARTCEWFVAHVT